MRKIGTPLALAALVSAAACATEPPEPPTLGPVDGFDLPGADLDRVSIGDAAPDFSLVSYRGDILTLSENWGEREILLVFYRGHW